MMALAELGLSTEDPFSENLMVIRRRDAEWRQQVNDEWDALDEETKEVILASSS